MILSIILALLSAAPHLVEDVAAAAGKMASQPNGLAKAQTALEATKAISGALEQATKSVG